MDYNLGVCDWTLNRIENPDAFLQAKKLGFDGVQIAFDIKNKDRSLLNPNNQDIYLRESEKWGVKICSCCAIHFHDSPLSLDENSSQIMEDFLKAMNDMGIKIIMLPFFESGDINQPATLRAKLGRVKRWVKRMPSKKWMYNKSVAILRDIAELAEKYSLTIGLETLMTGKNILAMVEKIESPSIKVYFDAGNMNSMGYDPLKELQTIGLSNICQIHIKEMETNLGTGPIDYSGILNWLKNNNYQDWLVVEASINNDMGFEKSMKENLSYLNSILGTNKV